MIEWEYTIQDQRGIHARTAGGLAHTAAVYPCRLTMESHGRMADVRNVIAVMSLGVKYGQTIKITAEGVTEAEALDAVKHLLMTEA